MPFDYSTPPPQSALNLIPAKTIALVRMTVNAGGIGDAGAWTHSKDGACELLKYSLVVLAGEYVKHKIRGQFIVDGPLDKYERQIWDGRKIRKRILDSAFNLDPNDMSAEAHVIRNVDDIAFDNLVFYARIGVEAGNGDWPAKNILAGTVTKNESDWPGPIDQPSRDSPPPVSPSASSPPVPIARPAWAKEQG